ncbi:MAG: hypothetical protein H6598_09335 [Flavobacteriales bacterium]|nr:hypothetical protein [Flavobacteriales bacterium]
MISFLRWGTVLMFLSRAYEHIRWGGPYRDIFYHPQGLGGWYANLIDRPLKEIYNDHFYEHALSYFSKGIGVIFLLTAVVILFYERLVKFKWILYPTSFFLLLYYFGLLYGKNLQQFGMFFEHMGQFVIPWCFVFAVENKWRRTMWWAISGISLTFFCHGLYAMGYYPQPGHFADMMISGFGMTEDTSRYLLKWIGYIDLVFAFLVFLTPTLSNQKGWKELVWINLWYAIIWGFLTAVARIYTSYTPGMFGHWMDQHLFQTIVRIPHFVIPIVIWLYYFRSKEIKG